jgi:hypothetical protein
MSQNARVALWVPTTTPPNSTNDVVVSKSLPNAISAIATAFELKASGGSGGGIEEAPVDGQQYARQDAGWSVVVGGSGGGGIAEAPTDGKPYVRQSSAWAAFDLIDGGTF